MLILESLNQFLVFQCFTGFNSCFPIIRVKGFYAGEAGSWQPKAVEFTVTTDKLVLEIINMECLVGSWEFVIFVGDSSGHMESHEIELVVY